MIDATVAIQAFERLGRELTNFGKAEPVSIAVIGGVAGLLGGWLAEDRVTVDCDVMGFDDDAAWAELEWAASAVAASMGLQPDWLNRDCKAFGWCLPLGWRGRLEPVGTFGPLTVRRLARIDLICMKVVAAVRRSKDMEDLKHLRPTEFERVAVHEYLDRMESEHLDRKSYDPERAILEGLREEGGAA